MSPKLGFGRVTYWTSEERTLCRTIGTSLPQCRPATKKGPPADLRKASDDLKAKVAEAKRRNDMPLDSALGNPNWEKNAADGHLDVRDEEGDE
jgi:hypothetical protein